MLTGGCLCGRIRYEATGEPYHETICHCGMCRRAAGAPFGAWFSVPRTGFRWLGEEPRRYASSALAARGFCPHCGSSLTYESNRHTAEIDLAIASLDQPEAMVPRDHIFISARLPWVKLADGLPEYPEERPGADLSR